MTTPQLTRNFEREDPRVLAAARRFLETIFSEAPRAAERLAAPGFAWFGAPLARADWDRPHLALGAKVAIGAVRAVPDTLLKQRRAEALVLVDLSLPRRSGGREEVTVLVAVDRQDTRIERVEDPAWVKAALERTGQG
ncbi:MAG: hypothetical protein U1E65_29775 [Myxococcota bacterium]